MARAHFDYIRFQIFRTVAEAKTKDPKVRSYLLLLAKIHALDVLLKKGIPAFDNGFFGTGSLKNLKAALNQCLNELRPQILNLVESPYLPDHFHPSVIGNEYGDIYELQLELAKNSRLNQTEVPSYFETLIKPILKGKL